MLSDGKGEEITEFYDKILSMLVIVQISKHNLKKW